MPFSRAAASLVTAAVAAGFAFFATPASGAVSVRHPMLAHSASNGSSETSTNWAGYAVGHAKPFTSVTGRWVQPAADCTAGTTTFSAFWIGLGGFSRSSYAVEQVGTQANCFFATPTYSVWYELFPAPPVAIRLRVSPSDMLSATVRVVKKAVYIRFKNVTTNKLFTKTLRMNRPDLGSAEWIAEAPTGCDYLGNCQTLPLTNFGTVDFSHGSASVKGHRGRISDPTWSSTTIELRGDEGSDQSSAAGANAIPGALGVDGGSFTVSWQQLALPAPAS